MTERKQQRELDAASDLPRARIAKRWTLSWFWLVPLAALGFAAWLVIRNHLQKGPTITVTFKDARGLEAGKSQLKFRGAQVGEVSGVEVSEDLQSVHVRIQLDRSAEKLARAQSQFWIVEPEVTAERIRGLRTIVSGDYVEVKPGDGPHAEEFVGLEEVPLLAHDRPGLQIVLLREQLGSIDKGTPILYRGLQVGAVTDFQLATNGLAVLINTHIEERYAPLVRENTRFWNAGGLQLKVGLLGADVRANSLQTLISGGIAFNTPPESSSEAKDGATYRIYDKPEEKWEKWAAPVQLPSTAEPTPLRAKTPSALNEK